MELENVNAVKKLLNITANDYWHYHYRFDEEAPYKPKKLGSVIIDNIIINTIVPVLFAYGLYQNVQQWKDRAIQYLSELAPEQNAITKQWKIKKVTNENALDSQALIELKNNYCNLKHCLQCSVGTKILKSKE